MCVRRRVFRICIAFDAALDRWLLLFLEHHLVGDHTTLDVMQEEIQAHLLGQTDQLPKPIPFRNLVAQARFGVSQEEHEAFFRQMLGDIDEPDGTLWSPGRAGRWREKSREARFQGRQRFIQAPA